MYVYKPEIKCGYMIYVSLVVMPCDFVLTVFGFIN